MVVPHLLPRMVERRSDLAHRVDRFYFRIFVAVAATSGEGEVIECSFAALRDRENVFDRKRLGSVVHCALAIFTAPIGAIDNVLLSDCDVASRHTRAATPGQAAASSREATLAASAPR